MLWRAAISTTTTLTVHVLNELETTPGGSAVTKLISISR